MKYKLTIQSEDYSFLKEALMLRTVLIVETLDKQVAEQVAQAAKLTEAFGPCSFASAPVKQEGEPVSITVNVDKKKKPHWTQTPRGKKIIAARKRKGQK